VSGTVRWTDSEGDLHPAKGVKVSILDDDLILDDEIKTIYTNDDGTYNATIENDDSKIERGLDIFVRVYSEGENFKVENTTLFPDVYSSESNVDDNVDDGSLIVNDFTFNNKDDNNTAFSVHQALVMASEYVKKMNGSMLDSITVKYPDASKGTSCYGSDGKLHILGGDKFDWDVLHHEYGHYVQHCLDIANSPGGSHSLGDNLADKLGKDKGIRLAWGEGWATYFGTLLQKESNASALNVPNVGDTHYQDTDDSNIDYDLEEGSAGDNGGEDNELSVQRVLWDLTDVEIDKGDGITISSDCIWKAIDDANTENLSQAIRAISADMDINFKTSMGSVLTEHKVAPRILTPEDNSKISADSIPTFSLEPNGTGKMKNNRFVVEFYDSTYSKLLFATNELSTTSYTPTKEEWEKIRSGLDRSVKCVVKATQADYPETGAYYTREVTLKKSPKLDLVFLIDTTGSMGDDIDRVKRSVNEIIQKVGSSVSDYRIALADYKDFPQDPYGDPNDYPYKGRIAFTKDTNAIIVAVNSLYASGGNDTPESVYKALVSSIAAKDIGKWRDDADKAIIVMGDAPPHDPEPITGYTLKTVIDYAKNINIMPDPPIINTVNSIQYMDEQQYSLSSVRIYSIAIGYDSQTRDYFNKLSEGTGGKMFVAANASDVVESILQAIDSIGNEPPKPVNQAPDTKLACPSIEKIWPVDGRMVEVNILNVTDPDGDQVTITITGITQDEPVTGKGNDNVDGLGIGTSNAFVRAKRDGKGNGRVYKISFIASDSKGAKSEGYVYVLVPHDQGNNTVTIDDGQVYNSIESIGR